MDLDRPFRSGGGGGSEHAFAALGSIETGCSRCGGTFPCECGGALACFVDEMRRELADNDRKGGRSAWVEADPDYLLNEVVYHVAKLHGAVRAHRDGVEGAMDAVREHTADVANLALMVADASGVLYASRVAGGRDDGGPAPSMSTEKDAR